MLLVIALSMLLTPALFWLHGVLARRLGDRPAAAADEIDAQGPVIIAGMGRFGQVVNRMLSGLGHRTVVIDSHPETVERMRALGIKAYLRRRRPAGAAGRRPASPRRRRWCWRSTIPRRACGWREYIRRRYPEVRIIARARDRHHVYQLYAAGAQDSVREVFDSSVHAGKYALAALGHDEDEIEEVADEFVEPRPPDAGGTRRALEAGRSGRAQRRLPRQGAGAERRDRSGAAQPRGRARQRAPGAEPVATPGADQAK